MGRGSLKALSLACAGIGVFLKRERSIYVKDTLLSSKHRQLCYRARIGLMIYQPLNILVYTPSLGTSRVSKTQMGI